MGLDRMEITKTTPGVQEERKRDMYFQIGTEGLVNASKCDSYLPSPVALFFVFAFFLISLSNIKKKKKKRVDCH